MATCSRKFFEKVYEGRRFAAILGVDGPYIVDVDSNNGVAIGPSEIASCKRGDMFSPKVEGWWVAKYGNQPRINLVSLSKAAREGLAADFGLPILSEESFGKEAEQFNSSVAFEGLCRWVMAHPRLYKQCENYGRSYMSWVEMVEAWKIKEGIQQKRTTRMTSATTN